MSDTDSFIEEVSEEVRRDNLFKLMRKYGWIAILAVLVLVGGAAFNEWQKAKHMATSQALGDDLLAALDNPDEQSRIAALAKIQGASSGANALAVLMRANQEQAAGNSAAAILTFELVANDITLPREYRDMATLKLVLLAGSDLSVEDRRGKLSALATGGAPFRLLAQEQLAMLDIEEGNSDAAISRLQDITVDVEVTAGLRNRAMQLIVVLGGEIDAQ